jgi:UDP-N-acetylglucosamine 2-epimerase (non-hydrolysing)
MMKLSILIGTRPNFIKVTRFKEVAMKLGNIQVTVIHTGQHYDANMSEVFFDQFELKPDHFLNINPASPNTQMAEIMLKLEALFDEIGKPDWLIVPGDVNSTLAGALTANKLGIKLAHLESGLRSFDRTMPEEHNRVLTDKLSDMFFVTEQSGLDHLKSENVEDERVKFVGNTMIDTMVKFSKQIDDSSILKDLGLSPKQFILTTLHRPANVDTKEGQHTLINMLESIASFHQVVFPVHPRTKTALQNAGLWARLEENKSLTMLDPIGYFEFQNLVKHCFAVVTDSGGIQEETTFRQVPCITLRPNTERPVTIDIGSNILLPFDQKIVLDRLQKIDSGDIPNGEIPPNWDGKSTERILNCLLEATT